MDNEINTVLPENNDTVSERTDMPETRYETRDINAGESNVNDSMSGIDNELTSKKVSDKIEDNTESNSVNNQVGAVKKYKGGLIAICIIAILLIGGAITYFFVFAHNNNDDNSKYEKTRVVQAEKGNDSTAYLPLKGGSSFKITSEVKDARVSKDRNVIAYLYPDGHLYARRMDQDSDISISENVTSLVLLGNNSVLYRDSDDKLHKFLLSDSSDIALGTGHYGSSEDGEYIGFFKYDGVYVMNEASSEKEKISTIAESTTDSMGIRFVSNDGKTVFWGEQSEDKSGTETVYCFKNGERFKVGTFETESSYISTDVTSNACQSFYIVSDYGSEYMYIVTETNNVIKVRLGKDFSNYIIYTANDTLKYDDSVAYTGIYMHMYDDGKFNIYYIDNQGDKEKVISNAKQYVILDEIIYYIDEDDNFRMAKLSGATLLDDEKITGNVDKFIAQRGYIAFFKDTGKDNTASLYIYKKGDKDITKISSDAYAGSIAQSVDGKTLYYYKDVEEIDGTYQNLGNLYKFTYGDSDSTKIASDVLTGTIDSGYISYLINDNSFHYIKYGSKSKEKLSEYSDMCYVIGDWYYYNGEESKLLGNDVKVDF